MNTIGNIIKLTFFGESHGETMGVIIDNLPAGIKIDPTGIDSWLEKRRPKSSLSTSRSELDEWKIVSGYLDDHTTSAALAVLIKNTKMQSEDYEPLRFVPRPGHADFPAYSKYAGYNDPRGGGIFSGRLTVLWMIVGAIAEQILAQKNIAVFSHISSIKDIKDVVFANDLLNDEFVNMLKSSSFPVIDSVISQQMKKLILNAKSMGDSVGGTVETIVVGLPAGVGEPLFASCESVLSFNLFSIPGIKAIEFGTGFEITEKYGSEANDPYFYSEGKVITKTNNNGGIIGGLTTGMPLVFRSAIKPTSSIAINQNSVNLQTKKDVEIMVTGRHDPCIVPRVVHVINAVTSYTILDLLNLSVSGLRGDT
ncbi:MAG TPA: chorismate synthase [Candidatus Izemoplasmatales bacterium]|nr:chorismate synthase [Candidatus Izemoplasmatales bacterium]